jgi:Spy/CpxP family protein refolding chaperone
MTRAATVDEATYALQVQEVQSLGARLGESRTMMLYRIYRELQPEQYKKLQEIFARRAAQHTGGNGR